LSSTASQGEGVDQGDERSDEQPPERERETSHAAESTDASEAGPMEAPVTSSGSHREEGDTSVLPGRARGSLPNGARVGSFTIERTLQDAPDERIYLARELDADANPGAFVTLVERPREAFAGADRVIALRLRHPRLLAPRALITHGGRDFLALEALASADGTPAPTVGQGARLDVADALRAGTGLADALSYLHRNDVAHLHVAPDAILVTGGRAYLGGMEGAEHVGATIDEAAPLFARDANFLARSLGVLAGMAADAPPDDDVTRENLRRIVAHGEAEGFSGSAEVAAACGVAMETATRALPMVPPEAATQRFELVAGCATTVGMVRGQNQDASALVTFTVNDDWADDMPVGIFLVADGMGGEASGEVASRIAARVVSTEMTRSFVVPAIVKPALEGTEESSEESSETPVEAAQDSQASETSELVTALAQAAGVANDRIRALAVQLGQTTGTTLTAVAVRGASAALAHVGDSRAYLLRGDVMAQLTEDHSVLARLQAVDHPLLSDPEVFVPRGMLYRSLGQEDESGPDLLDFTVAAGDRLLICSDGLWDEVDTQLIADTLAVATDPTGCARTLVALANASGGHDNSTAVVVFIRAVPEDESGAEDGGADDNGEPTPLPEESEDA
jgi:serine/threonine protein phosphatase PrpC